MDIQGNPEKEMARKRRRADMKGERIIITLCFVIW